MKLLQSLLLALIFTTSTALANEDIAVSPGAFGDYETKILGGTESKSGDWPWIAALLRSRIPDLYNAQYCSGVLIHDSWILTAAHCVYNLSTKDVEVAVGVFDLSAFPGNRKSVKTIRIHPQYNRDSWRNDIALLELAQPSGKPTIPLFTGDSYEDVDSSLLGKIVTALGWGLADGTSSWYYPERLRQVNLPVVADSYCNNIYPSPFAPIAGSQLCAGYYIDKDTCKGDSGGPVITRIDATWVHVGLTSFGAPCEDYYGWYGVYTRTSEFLDFIKQYVPNADFWPPRKSLPWLMLLLENTPPPP